MTHDSLDASLPDMTSLMTGLIDDALYPVHERISQSNDNPLSQEDHDKLVCYRTSADNALDNLLTGSTGVNSLLIKAMTNRDNPATQEEVLKTLSILSGVSQLMQSLLMVRDDVEYLLEESSNRTKSAEIVEIQALQSASA